MYIVPVYRLIYILRIQLSTETNKKNKQKKKLLKYYEFVSQGKQLGKLNPLQV